MEMQTLLSMGKDDKIWPLKSALFWDQMVHIQDS